MKNLIIILFSVVLTLASCELKQNANIKEVTEYYEISDSTNFKTDTSYSNWVSVKQELEKRNIPCSCLLTKVSIVEAGWKYESYLAKNANNIFGFICVTDSCVKGHSYFNSKKECINFMERWVKVSPPEPNEECIAWLKRRNYNPNPAYYNYVNNIKLAYVN